MANQNTDPRTRLKRPFSELYPSANIAVPTTKPGGQIPSIPRIPITTEEASSPSATPAPATQLQSPPSPPVQFTPQFTELDDQTAQQLIDSGQFIGLDQTSIRKITYRHPKILLASLSQTILDIVLFTYRAGWSELTQSERNTMPWLTAAFDWGVTSTDLYENSHQLPDDHPMKPICLNTARQMAEWEQQHKIVSWYFRDSKPLDRLLQLPFPVGPDGWPLNRLDPNGDPLPQEQLYSQATIFFTYTQNKHSESVQKLINKTAKEALLSGRITLVQQ